MNNFDEKKTNPILVILGIAAAIFAGLTAFWAILNRITMKKVNAIEGRNNVMKSLFFSKGNVCVNDDTDNVYANCIFGDMEIDVPEISEEVLCIELFNLFGKTTIKMPEGINVVYAADNKVTKLVTDYWAKNEDVTPAVYIIGKNIASNVKLIKKSEER